MQPETRGDAVIHNTMPPVGNGRGAAPESMLAAFVRQRNVLLTTYRRDGTPVGTPVHIAVDGGRAFIRTWDTAGKAKRIRNNAAVEIAPSTLRGAPTGPALHARARILAGDEAAHAADAITRKYPLLHGFVIPMVHRLRGNTTVHIELMPTDA